MAGVIGIRREDKNIFESRTPLTPESVADLVESFGLKVVVQPSEQRVHHADEYEEVGASVSEELTETDVVFGVKEVPVKYLLPGKAYAFFAHVVKGQPYNMAMLARLKELKCTLIDYEKVTDDKGRRLIFFGRHAGLAGMLDSLWTLGQRLEWEGYNTPFALLNPAWQYGSLEAIRGAMGVIRKALQRDGLPQKLTPLVIGIAGYGNVSAGAQELLECLHPTAVEPRELSKLIARGTWSQKAVYKVVFEERHLVKPRDPSATFDLQQYYQQPELYESRFETFLPHLSVLVNCIYWNTQYPRLVTRQYLKEARDAGSLKLKVIGDISCDVEGSIEATVKSTNPSNPVYVYDIDNHRAIDGIAGEGPVILAVETLPCELPREASQHFSASLEAYVPAIATADYSVPFDDLDLPPEIKRAVIVYQGKLTPAYEYLRPHLEALERRKVS